jgi:serine/threonine protein kinase
MTQGDLGFYFPTFSEFRVIGRGSVSTVFSATHSKSRLPVAIKQIHINRLRGRTASDIMAFETRLLKCVDSHFITKFFQVIQTEDSVYTVMEFVQNDTLLALLNQTKLSIAEILRIFCQLVCAVSYLHQDLDLVHRDIKIENILFDECLNIKLADLGLSKPVCGSDPQLTTVCGSMPYCAPEVFQQVPYGKPVDIWSLGVCLYAMVYGRLPFFSSTHSGMVDQILRAEPEIQPATSPMIADLLTRMLKKSPEERIRIEEIAQHPWIRTSVYSGYFDRKFWDSMNQTTIDADISGFFERRGLDISLIAKDGSEEMIIFKILKRRKVSRIINPDTGPQYGIQFSHRSNDSFHGMARAQDGSDKGRFGTGKRVTVAPGRVVIRPSKKPNTLYGMVVNQVR